MADEDEVIKNFKASAIILGIFSSTTVQQILKDKYIQSTEDVKDIDNDWGEQSWDKNQDCNCWIMENDKSVTIQSKNEIPLGHKIAMVDLNKGDTILKYGHDIGKVVKSIKKGEHVHVHNVKTKKW